MTSKAQRNEQIIREFYKTSNAKDFERAAKLIHEDYEMLDVGLVDEGTREISFPQYDHKPGKAGFLSRIKGLMEGYSAESLEIVKILSSDDEVWCWTQSSAIHTGNLWGIPPTNKEIRQTNVATWVIKDGKIYRGAGMQDNLPLFQQLGRTIFAQNNEESINKYLDQLKALGLIK